jgi:serine protease inhibitor
MTRTLRTILVMAGATGVVLAALVVTAGGRGGGSDAERPAGSRLAPAVAANNAFAVDLYHELAQGSDNLVFAPLSVHQALSMVSVGARGDTGAQMSEALHLATMPSTSRHPALGRLGDSLPSRGGKRPGKGWGFRLALSNALWAQAGYDVETPFVSTLRNGYGAGLRRQDFIAQPELSRRTINRWADRATRGRIDELLPAGSIDDLTRLVITNAIHFKARWRQRFREAGERQFTLANGESIQADSMSRRGPLRYAHGNGYRAAEIAYRGGKYSMLLIVPDRGRFEQIERRIDRKFLALAAKGLERAKDAILTLPPFEFESDTELTTPLRALGIEDAFSWTAADFTGINSAAREEGLHISGVFHDAFIRVDELGTEAAAATGVVAGIVSAPSVSLTVDRPFVYAIRARDTGAIVFLGRVMRP